MNLNERISKILEESELTSSEFADEIDVQRSSISHVTSGRNKPSLEFITKIKARFPDLNWDWIINGEGEMRKIEDKKKAISKSVDVDKKTIALPDLFALIDDDQFGITESEDTIKKADLRESKIPPTDELASKTADSHRLEKNADPFKVQLNNSQEVTLKRIVMFYSNGKFESFDQ